MEKPSVINRENFKKLDMNSRRCCIADRTLKELKVIAKKLGIDPAGNHITLRNKILHL